MAGMDATAGGQLSPEERSAVEELDVLVMEEERVVTAKWLCRHMAIPIVSAKRIMKQYCAEKENKVQPVWQVSGWLSPSKNGEGKGLLEPVFQVSIVSSSRLAEVSKQYQDSPVPHVYSVQKTLPVDPAMLCVAEREQAKEIAPRPDATNFVKDNRFSAVLFTPSTPPRSREAQATVLLSTREAPEPAKDSAPAKAEAKTRPAGLVTKGVSGTGAAMMADEGEAGPKAGPKKEEVKAGVKGNTGSSATPKVHASSASPAANGSTRAAAPSGNSLASLWKNKGSGTQAKSSGGKLEKPGGSPATGPGPKGLGSKEEDKKGVEATKREKEEEEEWFDEEVVDGAAEFARLRAGEVGSSGGGAQKKPKKMRIVDDEEEEAGEEQPVAEGGESVVAEGPSTREPATAGEARSAATPKSSSQGRDFDPMDVATEAAKDSEASVEELGTQAGEGEPRPAAGDKTEQEATPIEPLSAATVNVKMESSSQPGQSNKRRKLKTVMDDKGRETTIVEWEPAGGDEAPAAAPRPASATPEPGGNRNGAGGGGAGKGSKSSSGSPTENSGTSKSAPARAKPAKPAAAKAGQGSITSFFKKR